MYTLGIETSCDETSAAIVENASRVLSNIVASSINLHKKYAGIIPEIASRAQLESIYPVVKEALKKAGIGLDRIGLISVTKGPGLSGSLLVGLIFAKGLCLARGIPLIGVDHVKAHLYAPLLTEKIKPPFTGLVVSGGHTSLFYVKDFVSFTLLGHTVDDAAGEAFDKTAKILGLGYPGGPHIERLARKGKKGKAKFSCGDLEKDFNFSFSGIKTAVLYKVKGQKSKVKNQDKADIAYAFQESVFDDIADKSLRACLKNNSRILVAGGGVTCNRRLRDRLTTACARHKIKVYFPEKKYCLDNAAMVAGLGYQTYKKGRRSTLALNIEPT